MADWRDQLRPASFRGVPFGVVSADKEGGRRTVVHEFPQRDSIYTEDMGQATNRFVVEAFVLGADYLSSRDALEEALQKAGPGTLVHPWYGEITVSQSAPYKVKHSASDGGMATFTLSFVREGEASSPTALVHPQNRAQEKITQARQQAFLVFSAFFKTKGQTAFVLSEARKSATTALQLLQKAVGSSGKSPVDLSAEGLLASVQQTITASPLPPASKASALLSMAEGTPCPPAFSSGSVGSRVTANDLALANFVRHISLAEAAGALAITVPKSRLEAQGLREAFVTSLDAVLGEAGVDDTLYSSFIGVRATTLTAMAENARTTPQVIWHTPVAVLPSLVLCYQLTAGISLEQDFVSRNKVQHPGFVPVQKLEVLTHG